MRPGVKTALVLELQHWMLVKSQFCYIEANDFARSVSIYAMAPFDRLLDHIGKFSGLRIEVINLPVFVF
jgi:hypothetical protein